ncbi:methyltransferase domain-containing protein [Acidocella sp. KAb 2-4]|uniref:methyltransferase domain-containing protein n=1 Tax=Acidocella sp. KAb 2-4 TaxID=2885158 RepID=UPI001D0684EA|nr:methyltransferase domain-containing protein [Acidocella sp. KAb 2-4]MCB5944916.1 class I SAM-dependent methyltransferase [Acidocella sp. KAb 2-4]
MQPIFDFEAMRMHRARAAGRIAPLLPVLEDLGERLLDRLDDTSRRFATALDFGGRGAIAPALAARGIEVASADFAPEMAARAGGMPLMLAGPDDFDLPAEAYDLVVAHLALHWLDDLPGALIQLKRALKPDGLLLASMPVLGTLQTLREALLEAEEALTGGVSPRVSPFPELRDCAGLLQRAGFAHPVADAEEIELLYANPLDLLHELRNAGEANALLARARRCPPRALFPAALAALPVQDGRTKAVLRMAILTGWAS